MTLQRFAVIVGIVFLILGTAGLFIDDLFGLIHFDAVHNVIHLGVGVLGLLASGKADASLLYAKLLGVGYMLLGIIGMIVPDMFGLMSMLLSENLLHLTVGAIALYLGFEAIPETVTENLKRKTS